MDEGQGVRDRQGVRAGAVGQAAIDALKAAGADETLGKTDDVSIGRHLLDRCAREVRKSLDLPSKREAAQQGRPTGCWSLDNLDLADSLNWEIWTRSPAEQDRIQPYRNNWAADEIGAQQAMRHPYRLPWEAHTVGQRSRRLATLLDSGSSGRQDFGGNATSLVRSSGASSNRG